MQMTTPPSITLIDDEVIDHFIFKTLFGTIRPGLDIQCFSNPCKVLDLIRQNLFQTSSVVLDINMPEMSGWDFLSELEKIGIEIPVYMLTSSKDLMDRETSKKFRNVKGFFTKPLTVEDIKIILGNVE